jgi:hypothetical protein
MLCVSWRALVAAERLRAILGLDKLFKVCPDLLKLFGAFHDSRVLLLFNYPTKVSYLFKQVKLLPQL